MSMMEGEPTPRWVAEQELHAEQFRRTVEEWKAKLTALPSRPWWHTLIPFTIEIKRREP